MRRLAPLVIVVLSLSSCDEHEARHEDGVIATGIGPAPTTSNTGAAPSDAPRPNLERLRARAVREFGTLSLPAAPPDEAKIDLGRKLYYDARLSKNHDVSCQTCHLLEDYGVDGEATSEGHKAQRGERNAPTVYNARVHIAQFWDGRAADLVEQAKGPVLNPIEMALPDEAAALRVLRSIPGYVEAFAVAFPDAKEPVTFDNMARAIAAFEERLVTPGPFDAFLAGDDTAIGLEAQRGLQLFFDAECTQCHTGPALGGTMFQKLGSVKPFPSKDVGRFAVTQNEKEKGFFKVPTLRNIGKTAPYLHDGSVKELGEMVQIMVEHQTAKGRLSEGDLQLLLAFFETLVGPLPSDYIARPELPPSGPETPAPDPS